MRPVLFEITLFGAELALPAYGTFMVLAWIAGPAIGAYVAHRLGLPWRRVLVLLGIALAAGIVGARVFDLGIAWTFYAEEPARIVALDFAGFSLYGGLLVAGLVGWALAQRWKLPAWRLADATVPAIAAGVVLMRTGCFLNGCCFGEVTTLPWGVTYAPGSPAWTYQIASGKLGLSGLLGTVLPTHPTQLYEALAAIVLCGLAILLLRPRRDGVRRPDGVAFLAFAIGFTLFRLANGFLRVRQPVITAPEWFYPAFYTVLAGVFVWLLVVRTRAEKG